VLKPPQPIIVTALFPQMLEELLALLAGLPPEGWGRPTVCSSWSVYDVALHLLGDDVQILSSHRDGHSLPASIAGWPDLVSYVNSQNALWVQAARRASPRVLIDLLRLTGTQVCEYLQTLDLHSFGGSVSWVGPDPAPVWLDVAREYTERWHHQQHIRDAVGRPGLKQPRFLAPVLEAFMRALPRTYRGVSAPDGTSVAVTVRGESGGTWSVSREGECWVLYVGAAAEPDATVSLDQDVGWRIFTRGLAQAEAREKVAVVGDQALGLKVLDMVSIIA
jgi:uncharacterized protein (TIGR03083 family)